MRDYLLLTGATGLIGRYLLLELLQSETPLAVLVRPQEGRSAVDRIEEIVSDLEGQEGVSLPRPVCLEGDISSPNIGMNAEAQAWVSCHCSRFLHNAASVTFDGGDPTGEPWVSNLQGTKEVLRVIEKAKIKEVHWVSTAYVCGKRSEIVQESDLDCGQSFRNDYEESKFQAENLVRSAPFIESLTVYRPGIVVGDSKTGYTNSYHNIYLYLKFTEMLSRSAERDEDGRWYHPVRLAFKKDESFNLVPVDWVVSAISHVLKNPECHGRTYHLTHPNPTTCEQLETAFSLFFNYYGVEFVDPENYSLNDASMVEEMFYNFLTSHNSYWRNHPKFDVSNSAEAFQHLSCPEIDVPCLVRLFEFATRNQFGRRCETESTEVVEAKR